MQNTLSDKLTLRKPLSPKSDNAECQKAYAELLKEYGELTKLCVDGVDQFISEEDRTKGVVVSLAQYNASVAEYLEKRTKYNEQYSGIIETIDDLKEKDFAAWRQREEEYARKFAEWSADSEAVSQVASKADKVLLEKFAEESKFEELEAEADVAWKRACQ